MKTIFNKILISAVFTALTGSAFTLTAASMPKAFNYIPKSCNLVGNINLKEIKTIQSVNKAISESQQQQIYKFLKSSGMSADNINDITYGMIIKNTKVKSPSFIAILQTENKCDLKNFVKDVKQYTESKTAGKPGIKISTTEVNGKNIYEYINTEEQNFNNHPIYCTGIDSHTIAVGTKDYIKECAENNGEKSVSVIADTQMVSLMGSKYQKDMVWMAVIVPDSFNKDFNKKSKVPHIKNGILSFNYKNKSLILKGLLNCATPSDVKKAMLPIQMFLGIFAMNPDSGINPEDINLTPSGNTLDINIKIPEKAINTIVESQTQSLNATTPSPSVKPGITNKPVSNLPVKNEKK
ncbi:MAG: hypothetical protein K9L78_00050 [Victivallales bacterium]|nr:hypothetical protein [Victivallales bacterium]MCF7888487.1 hypothetical protein [Victivallales bacterium]